MMKIAIAGSNGLAQFIAYYLSQVSAHNFIFLTRNINIGLSRERSWQVLVVKYDDREALAYTLKGIDVVVSTISGDAQMQLVRAAAIAQVRHSIPSAFTGPEQCQTQATDDVTWLSLIELLEHYSAASSMQYTIFTCGVFYERFGPGGLNESMQISSFVNRHGAIGEEGNFLVDLRSGKATIPVISGTEELSLCLTSVRDVARYVVATIQSWEDTAIWPTEIRFYTERLTISELKEICERVTGMSLVTTFTTPAALNHALEAAQQNGSLNEALAISQHIAVAQSHPAMDFTHSHIKLLPDILTFAQIPGAESNALEPFESWLWRVWSNPPSPTASKTVSTNTSGKKSGNSSRSGSNHKSKQSQPQAVISRNS